MDRRTLLRACLTAVGAAALPALTATGAAAMNTLDPSNPHYFPAAQIGELPDGRPILFRAACIRVDPDTPGGELHDGIYIHVNSAHPSVGIRRVGVSNGDLIIYYDTPRIAPLISAQFSADEALAARGIVVGASVGDHSRVRFGIGGQRIPLSDPRLRVPNANFWAAYTSVGEAP